MLENEGSLKKFTNEESLGNKKKSCRLQIFNRCGKQRLIQLGRKDDLKTSSDSRLNMIKGYLH